MVRLVFTGQLARSLPVPDIATDALALRDALEAAFEGNLPLRGCVLDE